MEFELLNIAWYGHYKCFSLLKVEFGLGDWIGHLLFFEWHEGDIMWDFLFLNGDKPNEVG